MTTRSIDLEGDGDDVRKAEIVPSDTPLPKRRGRPTKKETGERMRRLDELVPFTREGTSLEEEELHNQRFQAWQLGYTYSEIAAYSRVTDRSIEASVNFCLVRMPGAQSVHARNVADAHRAHRETGDDYHSALKGLLTDNESWLARSEGMKHWRKTVGLEKSGIHVNVNQNQQNVNISSQGASFESVMDSVRKRVTEGRNEDVMQELKENAADDLIDVPVTPGEGDIV